MLCQSTEQRVCTGGAQIINSLQFKRQAKYRVQEKAAPAFSSQCLPLHPPSPEEENGSIYFICKKISSAGFMLLKVENLIPSL